MSQRKPTECNAPAIAQMSVLPVFFKLDGKTVLVAGNGEGVDWKIELLLASGAHVRHVAEAEAGPVCRGNQRYQHVRGGWSKEDFSTIAIAIGAFDHDSDALQFASMARECAIPVNVIDKPGLCDFQFGSIVNRSPVIVSISTDGAAPILGQSIRTKIEQLLPGDLGVWAASAKKARIRITSAIPDLKIRKEFWRKFARTAFSTPAQEASAFFTNIGKNLNKSSGHVTLVGAGPGAADLLTLRAVRAMQAADVILFDDLVSDEVLDLARREAKRILVGKRGRRDSCRQDDINALMLKLARQGKHVVRLKSGDPMIFGRAGEEITMLTANGVAVDSIPGVTSAAAAASALGVSLTHRDHAQGVKFITAHCRNGTLPEMDWRACADHKTTLMVYMGGRTAGALAERLIAEGMAPETPVVAVQSISRPQEQRTSMSLKTLMSTTLEAQAPILICIGWVFEAVAANQYQDEDLYMAHPTTILSN